MIRRSIALAAVLIAGLVAGACSTGSSTANLEGTWQWTASTEASPPSQAVVPDPADYTITFNADGTFDAKADCNQVGGTYTADGSNIALVLGPSTLAMCPEDSLGDIYVAYLDQVATYAITGDELKMTFIDDAGTMTFTRS